MPLQPSLGGIVGQAHAPVLEEQREARPSLQDVIERLDQVMPAGEPGEPARAYRPEDPRPEAGSASAGPPDAPSALLPLMDRSISNSASIRRTTSIAIGESGISFLPAALRRAFSSMIGHGEERAPRMHPTRRLPDRARLASRPDRACCSRHRRPPAGCRHIRPDAPADARPCGRASNRTSPPAARRRQKAGRPEHRSSSVPYRSCPSASTGTVVSSP